MLEMILSSTLVCVCACVRTHIHISTLFRFCIIIRILKFNQYVMNRQESKIKKDINKQGKSTYIDWNCIMHDVIAVTSCVLTVRGRTNKFLTKFSGYQRIWSFLTGLWGFCISVLFLPGILGLCF